MTKTEVINLDGSKLVYTVGIVGGYIFYHCIVIN